jgi:hypothetical protein
MPGEINSYKAPSKECQPRSRHLLFGANKSLSKKQPENVKQDLRTWPHDQLTENLFFHQHLYDLLTIITEIEKIRGETLDWDLKLPGISNLAWNKIIHRGIKPLVVFPHPVVLETVPGSVGYYRMLAMVSPESMNWVRWKAILYESGESLPDKKAATAIARYLNQIINRMIKLDDQIDSQGRLFEEV